MGGDKRPYNGGDGKKNKKAFYGRVSPPSVDRRVVVFPAAAKEAALSEQTKSGHRLP